MKAPYTLDTRLDFGKHRGFKIRTLILRDNPVEDHVTYIRWCLNNIKRFKLSPEANVRYQRCLKMLGLESELPKKVVTRTVFVTSHPRESDLSFMRRLLKM